MIPTEEETQQILLRLTAKSIHAVGISFPRESTEDTHDNPPDKPTEDDVGQDEEPEDEPILTAE